MSDETRRKPFTKRERHRVTQSGLGYRPVNNWGDGDLPAPWAEGDVVQIAPGASLERLHGQSGPYYVVSYATSVDEGDAWYFRVWDGSIGHASDRLHVGFADRSGYGDVDWMDRFTLVETADPEGLALRERMLADGWTFRHRETCPTCGQVTSYGEGGIPSTEPAPSVPGDPEP